MTTRLYEASDCKKSPLVMRSTWTTRIPKAQPSGIPANTFLRSVGEVNHLPLT